MEPSARSGHRGTDAVSAAAAAPGDDGSDMAKAIVGTGQLRDGDEAMFFQGLARFL